MSAARRSRAWVGAIACVIAAGGCVMHPVLARDDDAGDTVAADAVDASDAADGGDALGEEPVTDHDGDIDDHNDDGGGTRDDSGTMHDDSGAD